MDAQFVDIRRNVGATDVRCEHGLLHAEHGGRESRNSAFLELPASLEPFPCRRDLDAYPLGVEVWGYMPEVGQNP